MADRRVLAVVGTALLAACATPLREENVELARVRARWLPTLLDDETPVAALTKSFGDPTATFEGGRLRCWVLMLVEKDLQVVVDADGAVQATPAVDRSSGEARSARRAALDAAGTLRPVTAQDLAERALWPTWREAECHLVVAVDANGYVVRHQLLRVLP